MSPQRYLYNGLARPADYSILYGNELAHLGRVHWHRNALAADARTDVGTRLTSGRTLDRQGENIMTPL